MKMFFVQLLCFNFVVTVVYCLNNDTVIWKNITKNQGYNKYIRRPVLNLSEPIIVEIEITLYTIHSLEMKDQILTTSVGIRMFWTDEFISWNGSSFGKTNKISAPFSEIWKPDVSLLNNAENKILFENEDKLVNIYSNGLVEWYDFVKIQTFCFVNTKKYPFETENCKLNFSSKNLDNKEQMLKISLQQNSLDQFTSNGEWTINKPEDIKAYTYLRKSGGKEFASVVLEINMYREQTYYLWKFVIPTIAISILDIVTFCLPATSNVKLTLSTFVVLSFTVMIQLFNESLPTSSNNISKFGVFLWLLLGISVMVVIANVFITAIFYRRLEICNRCITYIDLLFTQLYNSIFTCCKQRCTCTTTNTENAEHTKGNDSIHAPLLQESHELSDCKPVQNVQRFETGSTTLVQEQEAAHKSKKRKEKKKKQTKTPPHGKVVTADVHSIPDSLTSEDKQEAVHKSKKLKQKKKKHTKTPPRGKGVKRDGQDPQNIDPGSSVNDQGVNMDGQDHQNIEPVSSVNGHDGPMKEQTTEEQKTQSESDVNGKDKDSYQKYQDYNFIRQTQGPQTETIPDPEDQEGNQTKNNQKEDKITSTADIIVEIPDEDRTEGKGTQTETIPDPDEDRTEGKGKQTETISDPDEDRTEGKGTQTETIPDPDEDRTEGKGTQTETIPDPGKTKEDAKRSKEIKEDERKHRAATFDRIFFVLSFVLYGGAYLVYMSLIFID